MKQLLFAALLAITPLAVNAQDQSDERIKELALQAILENPEIIAEAITILNQQRQQAQAAANAQVLAEQRDFLENDPNAPFMGADNPTAVIVEFFDYNCPYCKRAAGNIKTLLAADPDIRVVYREWPVLGDASVLAARAALAARNQGKYEEMHWALMELQGRAQEATILSAAREIGLDIDQLRDDMQSDAVSAHLETSRSLAQALGFTGTPAFVIGDALVPGAVPLSDLETLVAAARAAQ